MESNQNKPARDTGLTTRYMKETRTMKYEKKKYKSKKFLAAAKPVRVESPKYYIVHPKGIVPGIRKENNPKKNKEQKK